jgi:hypothetical protein
MEKQNKSQPRASIDEKPPLERPKENEQQHTIESNPPLDDESSTPEENPKDSVEGEKEWEYITGLKLALVMTAVVLACFLMLLDNSIISTVSRPF